MITLTADEKWLAVLGQTKELTEIRDASGKVVGFFAPITIPHAEQSAVAAARLDPAEIARRKAENEKTFTTRQVFEHLLAQTPDDQRRAYLQEKIDKFTERDGCASR